MTTVNDITDILRIIREQPEWADALRAALLGQELLETPQRLTALTAAFTEFAENTNKRFAVLESDVAELKAGQARLEAGQTRLEGAVSRLEGQFGNLRGNSYEQKIGSIISSIMSERMNLLVRVLKRVDLDDDSEFFDLLHDAEGRGIISRRERDAVANADIVLQERRRPNDPAAYIVIEVSTTVADSDISRAVDRAGILGRATGQTTIAVVVGANVDDARRQLARERNVTLIAYGE